MNQEPDGLRHKAIAGVKWTFAGRLVDRVIRFGTMVVLSRLLLPADFGLFVLGISVAGAVTYLRSFGIDAALIQRDDAFDRRVSSTAFYILLAVGVLLYGLLYVASPLLGRLLDSESLPWVLRLMGLSVLIGAASKVPLALTEKRLAFRRVAASEVGGRIAFASVAIVLAASGLRTASLVWAFLARQLVTAAIIVIGARWLPSRGYDRQVGRELFGFGKFVAGSSLLRYLQSNLDKLVVGGWVGPAALGTYGLAFNIANIVNVQLVQPLRQVMFPTYSRMQNDLAALKRAFLESTKYILFVGAPICVGLVALSHEFITVVYTERWAAAAPVLEILAFYGLLRTLSDSAIPALRAIGRPGLDFQLMLLQVVVMGVTLVPAVKLGGAAGAAHALLLAGLLVVIRLGFLLAGVIRLEWRDVVRSAGPGCLAAAVMGLALFGLKLRVDVLGTPLGNWGLPLTIGGGAAIYTICLWFADRRGLLAIKGMLKTRSITRAVIAAADRPVTLKLRSGYRAADTDHEAFYRIAEGAFHAGAAAICVHGRTVGARYVGLADWDFITEVKRHFADRTIVGSGDVRKPADALRMLAETGVDGVAAARGALGNPWFFRQVDDLAAGREPCRPGLDEQHTALERHFDEAIEIYGPRRGPRIMRKHGIKYSRMHPTPKKVRMAFVEVKTPAHWHHVLDEFYAPR